MPDAQPLNKNAPDDAGALEFFADKADQYSAA